MTKAVKRIIAAALAAVLLAFVAAVCGCSCTPGVNFPEAAEEAEKCTVTVRSSSADGEDLAGTGFAVLGDGGTYIVTNYHVVAEATEIYVGVGGTERAAEVTAYYEYHDIALLEAEGLSGGLTESAFASPEVGEAAYSVGNERGKGKLVRSSGEVLEVGGAVKAEKLGEYADVGYGYKFVPVSTYSCSVVAGMSGCPIIGSDGSVVGIGTYRSGDSSDAVYYGIDPRFALAVAEAAERGGNGEVVLFGDGQYGLFLSEGAATALYGKYDFVFLGNYRSWSSSTRRLHPLGFTARLQENGLYVASVGESCPLFAGDVITAVDGISVVGKTYSELMLTFYDGYELAESGANGAALTLAGGGEAFLSGGGYAVVAR